MRKCPTCGKQPTTKYECLKCHAVCCNACFHDAGRKCPACGHAGKKSLPR